MLRKYPCDVFVPIEREPRHRLVLANDFARFFVVEIASHDHTLCHRHEHDYLMYVVGDAEIVSAPRDGEPKTLTYHDGDCELSAAGLVHVVENLRDTTFRNLVVELIPAVGELQRGSDPRIAFGDGIVQPILVEERISVWSLEMNADTRVEVHGPVIVATLFEEAFHPTYTGEMTEKVKQVHDVSWIPTGRSLMASDLGKTMRAIVFQLGRPQQQTAAVRKRTGEPIKGLRTHAQEPK